MRSDREIVCFMREFIPEKTDPATGEIDMTALAESAAEHFDMYEDDIDYRPIERLFELAALIAYNEWEDESCTI